MDGRTTSALFKPALTEVVWPNGECKTMTSSTGAVVRQRFDLREVAPRDRLTVLDEVAGRSSVPFRAQRLDPSRLLRYAHDSLMLGPLGINQTTLGNYVGHRSPAQARDSSEPRLVIALDTTGGPLRVEQEGRHVASSRGSIVPWWSVSAWTVRAGEVQTIRAVSVPLDAIGLPHLLIHDLLATDLGASPLGRLFSDHLDNTLRLPEMSPTVMATLSRVTIELLRALLSTAAGDEFSSREPLHRTLGVRIMLHIQGNVTDPTLSADSIAATFGISRRYLYLLLSRLDVSLAEWVRDERLQRAADALANPADAHVSIAAIAHQSGFLDHSSFSRAFKTKYGSTPTEWRDRSAGIPPTRPLGAAGSAWVVHWTHNKLHGQ
ncbi:helix-turn-helix domain-containing protein [Lysobacter korlensis]|uniref:Helix-turn-helix domain-containing protein n=1 Tax=Lysobacter korlensis TaxID=553636 RepID=A0ABV6RXM2_9GAMM